MDTHIVSGPGKQLAALSQETVRAGVEIHIAVLANAERPCPYVDYLRNAGLSFSVIHTSGRATFALIEEVRKVVLTHRPTIVQTHSYRPAFIIWWLRARGLRTKWIAFFHGHTQENLRVRVYNFIDQFVLRFADRTVVVAESQRKRFPFVRQLVRIANAALVEKSEIDETFATRLPASDVSTIGFFGRLSQEKGWDVFLDALSVVAKSGTNFRLIVAGDGPDRERFLGRVIELGFTERVCFLGQLPSVSHLYSSLDLLVLSSHTEGMPNVLLEAMHFDVPVVATAVGGVPEILQEPGAGRLSVPGDAEDLSRNIMASLREGRTDQGARARLNTANRFSLTNRVAEHIRLYKSVSE
jgi:glycosyltransferase involved in cell wall biosynthesis